MSLNKTDAEFEKAANAALNEDEVDPDPASISKVAAQTSTTIKNIWPLQKDAISFYGNPLAPDFMANLTHAKCPWKLQAAFEAGGGLIICHKKVVTSLTRVLNKTWDDIGRSQNTAHTLGYDIFDGSYVVRPKRGGTSLSMHAFGVAFDFDAAANQQHSFKHLFQHNTPLVDNFLAENWIWGGDWSAGSIDAMHFQAARVHP